MGKLIYFFAFISYFGYSQTTVPLEDILTITKKVIDEVQDKTAINLGRTGATQLNYQPKNVVFNFETANAKSTNVGIKILIFSIGKKWTKSITNNITYTYTYPDLNPMGEGESMADIFRFELTRTIMNALQEIEKLSEEDKSRLNEFSTKITFAVEKSTEGSGEFSLVPFTIGAGKSWNKKATHSVTVTYKRFIPEILRQ